MLFSLYLTKIYIIIYIHVTGKFEIQVEMISIQLNLILTWVEIESTKHEQKFNQLVNVRFS